MLRYLSLLSCLAIPGVKAAPFPDMEIVSRAEWGARPPSMVEKMENPVPFVVIHHSYIPAACYAPEECVKAMQRMQDYHQINQSWNDIGYSFAAGGDNRIYMGRGWSAVGAHAPGYNNKSIGICLIGDWRDELPPLSQLNTVTELINKGVAEGYIQQDYRLIGHRQVRETECPGDALYREIQTWPHWVPEPNISEPDLHALRQERSKIEPREESDAVFSLEHNKLLKRRSSNLDEPRSA